LRQFFFTLGEKGAPQCDRKHVVFGRVRGSDGLDVLRLIESEHAAAVATGAEPPPESPAVSLVVTACGEWSEDMPTQGYWAADDTFKPLY
jgi:cyclophilin family peptidyl-prolyl cis-trans isomerase